MLIGTGINKQKCELKRDIFLKSDFFILLCFCKTYLIKCPIFNIKIYFVYGFNERPYSFIFQLKMG